MRSKLTPLLTTFCLIALVAFVSGCSSDDSIDSGSKESTSSESKATEETGYIKSLPVAFGEFDPATGKAGDFDFNAGEPTFNQIMIDYGYKVPGNSVGGEKTNPQPTIYLPLGTKVLSMVDGTVYDVPKLYSNDFSVMVQVEGSDLIFETEHVINATVKKGDKVKAGQVIAEVSDYDTRNTPGLGLVEFGVLKGGNPPSHLCPTDYFHSSVKEKLEKQITDLHVAWETFKTDDTIYDESAFAAPGCLSRDAVEG